MDSKANLANRKKINELAVQHNKLTTLVGCLLNEINGLKKEIYDLRHGNDSSQSSSNHPPMPPQQNQNNMYRQQMGSKFQNFNNLSPEDILKQLSINQVDN